MSIQETILFAVDPGSIRLGYGFLKIKNNEIHHLSHGVLENSKLDSHQRLAYFRGCIDELLVETPADMAVIEKVFLGKNPQSIFRLGLSRGVALASIATYKIPIFEYAPTKMKKLLTGNGHATKSSISHTVKCLLNLKTEVQFDAADALGLAYVHARSHLNEIKMSQMKRL